MNAPLVLGIAGIGAWAPGATDWPSLRAILRGETTYADAPAARPAGTCLPAAERRRAPDGVRLAAEVASQAIAMAGIDPATLPCIFASAYGELGVTDYVCATLASAPRELSPTKFHNSVLNAPAGYWTIATGCTAPSSAVSAHALSFSAGLLEAAALAMSEATPVLYACCDVAATGPLASAVHVARAFGTALVLAPNDRGARLRITTAPTHTDATPSAAPLPALVRDNPASASALTLLSALAQGQPARVVLPLSSGLSLHMEVRF